MVGNCVIGFKQSDERQVFSKENLGSPVALRWQAAHSRSKMSDIKQSIIVSSSSYHLIEHYKLCKALTIKAELYQRKYERRSINFFPFQLILL